MNEINVEVVVGDSSVRLEGVSETMTDPRIIAAYAATLRSNSVLHWDSEA